MRPKTDELNDHDGHGDGHDHHGDRHDHHGHDHHGDRHVHHGDNNGHDHHVHVLHGHDGDVDHDAHGHDHEHVDNNGHNRYGIWLKPTRLIRPQNHMCAICYKEYTTDASSNRVSSVSSANTS